MKLKCPHCEVEIEWDDTIDINYDDDCITLNQVGHCPECDRDYQWEKSALFHSWSIDNFRLV